MLEKFYNVPSDEVAGTIANTAIIPIIFMVVAEICIGTIYDLFGRKKPLVFTYICSTIGTLITPLGSSLYWFQVTRIFVCILNITAMLPFIPDLLMEESHAMANAFRVISAILGSFLATILVGISAKDWITDENLYFSITAFQAFISIIIIFFMKDVINSDEFKARRKLTNTDSKK